MGWPMYSGRGRARDLYNHFVYQEATTDQVPRDIFGGIGQMGMHMDVGGHATDGGGWLAKGCNPGEYLSCGHGWIVHVHTIPM